VARAPALLAMAQVDDLAGETIAVNLREPTGSVQTGGASSTRKWRFCSKVVWRKRF